MSTALAFWIGIRNLWIYLRQRSGDYHPAHDKPSDPNELTVLKLGAGENTNRVLANKPAGGIRTAESIVITPPSVTEPTTKTLQAPFDNGSARS
jgi:hypothetical protein